MPLRTWILLWSMVMPSALLQARVVINEIFYHAPEDIRELAFIELHNADEDAVDIGGWEFTRGVKYKFPAGTEIPAGGFIVICRNQARFKRFYGVAAAGVFDSNLSAKGERLELVDARGRKVDSVKYSDDPPWPLGPDGLSGSLERMAPEAGSDNPANWASSPLAPDYRRPMGTPGRTNSCYSAELPPVIAGLKLVPEIAAPGQPVTVEATVRETRGVKNVSLFYRVAGPGFQKEEVSLAMRDSGAGQFVAEVPAQAAGSLIRCRVEAVGQGGARRTFPARTEPRPAVTAYVSGPIPAAGLPQAWIINTTEEELHSARERLLRSAAEERRGQGFGGPPGGERETRESAGSLSAFLYFDPATNRVEVFDFVEVEARKGGHKVHFAKGRSFRGMSTLNLTYEGPNSAVNEPLAYELYRRAGLAAPRSGNLRLWINGEPAGYQLYVEQINRAFLRQNQLHDGGNLYKLLWFGGGVVGQHEKKTNTRSGHDDLLDLLELMDKSGPAELWSVIRTNFDLVQVVNYFAVNTLLSHWDGFFNNYFTYHDLEGTGRWTMYPWDQDNTWGVAPMADRDTGLAEMPLSFGMRGDTPVGGAMWWRQPGYFSGPLLAQPEVRNLYLARTRQLLETVFTEQVFGAEIDAQAARLRPEVRLRAELARMDPDRALQRFDEQIRHLHHHLRQRRAFLLGQAEIQNAGPFSTAGLEPLPARKKAKKEKSTKP